MSNIAPPIPRLLSTVDRGKGLYTKRIENDARLLRWAILYLEKNTKWFKDNHTDGAGFIPERAVRIEIQRCEKWLQLAREQIK